MTSTISLAARICSRAWGEIIGIDARCVAGIGSVVEAGLFAGNLRGAGLDVAGGDALLRSIPSMGYVALLLALHFYIYAVIGVSMMGPTAPEHFGNLGRAMLTLFQVVTLEGWADLMRSQLGEGGGIRVGVVVYFVTFILLGTMIILNLLIGVIMNGMQEAQNESENASRDRHIKNGGAPSILDEINLAERQLGDLRHQLDLIRTRLRHPLGPSDRSARE
ncbi:MAG: ion transporter [Verrucomicrobiales bacterium]|nr:ion transporter [Verrucomicrobiales bacterium]